MIIFVSILTTFKVSNIGSSLKSNEQTKLSLSKSLMHTHLQVFKTVLFSLCYESITPTGVKFINVLQAAFTSADTKSAKMTVKSSSFFALSGSACVKAACRTLMKLTPDRALLLTLSPSKNHNLNPRSSTNKQTNKQTFHLLSQTHPFRFGLRVWRTFTDWKLYELNLTKIIFFRSQSFPRKIQSF